MTKDRGREGTGQDVPELRVVTEEDAFDPWQFENSGYSREKVYTKSRDKEGGQTTNRVHLSNLVAEEVAALVAERTIPEYRTPQDFIRDAVYHRLHDIAEMKQKGKLKRRVTAEMLNVRLQQQLRTLEENNLAVIQIEEVLESALKLGARGNLRMVLDLGWAEVEHMDQPWKSKVVGLLDKFEDEFGRLK